MALYGYARVSTAGQKLKDQISMLRKNGVRPKNIYHEKFTGTRLDRPEFQKLLKVLHDNDILVVAKLDRLARNTREALNVIHDLKQKGVIIKVIQPRMTVSNDIGGKIMYNTLLMVADIERDMIVERTQAGKRYAKAHDPNYREGRMKRTDINNPKYKHYYAIYRESLKKSAKKTADEFGISARNVQLNKAQFRKHFKEIEDKKENPNQTTIDDFIK
ncbi:resolvase [Philodulcilactobacillus myokoensis]|uniref:Resolvase n=1 Tax=Philodulcilactobacillus myokoensis TaxID=2929573 RepID=A0A9W6ERW1_9LACO|nr:recombinase family protein [Philodulcilactobacillus myokoensis]GLB46024.1 resolvase [Philodulcilactobacillus myokoensis]GLB46027.1 resolvase [Philodulcilactobacillus myokoensis]